MTRLQEVICDLVIGEQFLTTLDDYGYIMVTVPNSKIKFIQKRFPDLIFMRTIPQANKKSVQVFALECELNKESN